jgi:hypothetical protein
VAVMVEVFGVVTVVGGLAAVAFEDGDRRP